MTRRMGTKIISVEKQRVRDAMRVVCSPMSFDVRRKECESFLDAMFRANFEENAEVTLDILKSVGQKNECEQEPAEVAVCVSKCVLFYVRKAKTTDDASSLVQILFRSIATNELLSLRGKEIGSVGEFSALSAAVASMKMVKTEADVETLVESSAVHFRHSAYAFVHYLKAFGESVHDKNVGAIRPERRKLIAQYGGRRIR